MFVSRSALQQIEVWCPIVYAGRASACLPLLRLSAIAASTVPVDVKMSEAQRVADNFAAAAEEKGPAKKVPLGYLTCSLVAIACLSMG